MGITEVRYGDKEAAVEKTVVGLDERELQQLNIILMDEDAEGALAFLRDVVMAKIKSIPKATDCHPRYDD